MLKVHAAIARALHDNGTTDLFGLIGDANLYFADSFVRDCGGRFVSSANEAGAALMALGYTIATGKLGCATVTHGAALTNTLTALTHGAKARTPMLLICGDTNPTDRDNIQSTPQREHVMATGAGFEQLRSPTTIAQDMATCIRRAWAERRPIVLNMPVEIQWLDVDYAPHPFKRADQRMIVAESDDLDNAIGIVAAARRPMVLAGRGAIAPDAASAVARFAARLEAPLATTLQAKNLFAQADGNIGIFGTLSQDFAVEQIMEADCLICFGASLNDYTMSHGAFAKDKRIVHIDTDAAQFGRYLECDAYVLGDAGRTADLFTHWLDEAEIPGSGWNTSDFAAQVRAAPAGCTLPAASAEDAVDMPRAVRLLDETFADDRMLVTDGGRFLGEIWKNFGVADPADFVITVAFGSIGLGMGHAIGAAVGRPDRKVVHFTGDGGFVLGGLAEFNTAVRHNLDIVTIVCNDAAYGAEHIQFRRKGMDPALSMFDWPDFGKVAEALGGRGFSVSTFGDLQTALNAVKDHRGPVLIDMKFDPDAMPEFP
ncbi:thiamine pyrophosphate-binding protein (plasmid) [Novosphingobium resinovorum]|uniref:thiamine pyrophosphate-binding protein n=1 Tax=Novosphingobium TaxID=165696 RepID=UPI001B3C8D43|nr:MULTISPECIES: thiamine pyrophosphate-binding protein [Novosphingobium]MBF7015249.1 thiamine pyrophosphate-binding protein [Novosphingobium sp. HR1a]WJM29924.1 thiamine pyrophosphate-binding protein [Novosphingobium resinovorum]